jgi:AcrR family transcriptional regulator
MGDKGVGALTFDEVGRAGGFSRGLASQRFGSKRGLIEAVLAHLYQRQEAKLAKMGIDHLPGLDAMLAYVDFCLRDLSLKGEAQAYLRLLSSAVADASELRSPFAAQHALVERRLEAWVRKGQDEGAIRPEIAPEAAAMMIGCLVFGLSMQWLVDPETDVDAIRETSLATLRLSFGVDDRRPGA